MQTTNPFTTLSINESCTLSKCNRFEQAFHHWSQSELDALALAYAARRPLLLRGEPGSGKSQLARAAAMVLGTGVPEVQVIHPRFEPRDLLYRYDLVRRLGDAHEGKVLQDMAYIRKGVLWRVFERCSGTNGVLRPVLLIDEIDKADADVPNSLLEVLGNGSFAVDEVENRPVQRLPANAAPLILITTNEERELPAAFVRRCIVLNLNPPEDQAGFMQWLDDRVQAHADITEQVDAGVIQCALQQVWADRQETKQHGPLKVGLAEALDLLRGLADITKDVAREQRAEKQSEWLRRVSAYALVKHAGTYPGQSRVPQACSADTGK